MKRVLILFFTTTIVFSYADVSNVCYICKCSLSGDSVTVDCNGTFSGNQNTYLYYETNSTIDLILSNNGIDIEWLDRVIFKKVKTLDISHNNIERYFYDFIGIWDYLEEINLSFNNLSVLEVDFIHNFPSFSRGNWSYNSISDIKQLNSSATTAFSNLTHLDLSHNKLSTLTYETFQYFPKLKYLNLSSNSINSIARETFSGLEELDSLNLGNNCIKSVMFMLPYNLRQIFLAGNELSNVLRNEVDESNCSSCDLSARDLFSDIELHFLETLDVSYNNLTSIPTSLSEEHFPRLRTLVISGNPISNLTFPRKLKLEYLIMKNMTTLRNVGDDAFDNLTTGLNTTTNYQCINITLSSSKNLESFNERALYNANFDMCYLDLSDNGLSEINHIDFKKFKKSPIINLQGNPFICDCKMQWMLDEFVQQLYVHHSDLLVNLRCAGPEPLTNQQMVYWLKWEGRIFCNPEIVKNFNQKSIQAEKSEEIILEISTGMLLILIGSLIVALILLITGLVLSRKFLEKRRRQNRRF